MYGYRSSSKCYEEGWGTPTGTETFFICCSRDSYKSFFENKKESEEQQAKFVERYKSEDIEQLTAATIYWLGTLDDLGDDVNDYIHNLRTAASIGTVTSRIANLLASAIVSFKRDHNLFIEKEKKDQRKPSEYIGEIKKRFAIELEVAHADSWESDWGTTHFYRFLGPEDQIVVWFGSNSLGRWVDVDPGNDKTGQAWEKTEVGEKIWVKCTPKKHEERKGKGIWANQPAQKQTTVTRVTLLDGPPVQKKKRTKKGTNK